MYRQTRADLENVLGNGQSGRAARYRIQKKGQLTQRCDSKTVTAEVGAMDGIPDESCAGGDWQTGTRSAASCLVFGVESHKCRN